MSVWSMRTLARAATIYVFFAAIPVAGAAPRDVEKDFVTVNPPRPLAEIAVLTLEGESGDLAAGFPAGRPALLNLWATWCIPCVEELPALARLQQIMAGELAVMALSVDRGGPRVVGTFLAKTGTSGLNIRLDPRSESLQSLRARGLPTTLLLDAQHREIARIEGPVIWDAPETVARLRRLLTESAGVKESAGGGAP